MNSGKISHGLCPCLSTWRSEDNFGYQSSGILPTSFETWSPVSLVLSHSSRCSSPWGPVTFPAQDHTTSSTLYEGSHACKTSSLLTAIFSALAYSILTNRFPCCYSALVIAAVFDRNVNCRRAASVSSVVCTEFSFWRWGPVCGPLSPSYPMASKEIS